MEKIEIYDLIESDTYSDIYHIYIKALLGKLIKKGKKIKALNFYKRVKETIKLEMERKKEIFFILLLTLLNSMPKVAFKEMRLGSQKKDIPIPIDEKRQVLVSVDSILKFSKNKKKLEFTKLVSNILATSKNQGIMINNKKLKYKKAIINKMLLNIHTPKNKNWREQYNVSEETNYQIYKNKTAL
jgi:ribosomal protein S7